MLTLGDFLFFSFFLNPNLIGVPHGGSPCDQVTNLKHWPPASPPPRLGEAFLFSGSHERAGSPQATWVLPLGRFLLLPHPRSSPSKRLLFCSFTALEPAALPSSSPLRSCWAPWNSRANHPHSLPITSAHSSPHSFSNLRADQHSTSELGMALGMARREMPKIPARHGRS